MVDEKPFEELYDLVADPHEIDNFACSAEHGPRKRKMAKVLDDWMLRVGDQGGDPEDVALSDQWYDRTLRPHYIEKAKTRNGIGIDSTAEEYLRYWRSLYKIDE